MKNTIVQSLKIASMKNNPQKYDFLIVGQGLAGSCLSYQLIKRGQNVLVIDEGKGEVSSMVAAGLFNPVTGRKMVKTWMAEELFAYLDPFYRELEIKLGKQFLHYKPIYRPFGDIESYNEFMGKTADQKQDDFVMQVHHQSQFNYLHDQYGGIMLRRCGYLDIVTFLHAYRDFLKHTDRLISTRFEPGSLSLQADGVKYNGIEAEKIIFCTGSHQKGMFFEYLPFKPVKGEILFISPEEPIDNTYIYNKGVFMFEHKRDQQWWVGSTYHHHDLSWEASKSARAELKEKLKKLINTNFRIIKQEAGVRPATADRKPFIGLHSGHNQIGIFNGLGAKGVSLAPYFSEQFAKKLLYNESLQSEVDIMRYFPKLKS